MKALLALALSASLIGNFLLWEKVEHVERWSRACWDELGPKDSTAVPSPPVESNWQAVPDQPGWSWREKPAETITPERFEYEVIQR